MAKSTRQRLIDAAHDHFYRDGFHAVGLDQILREVGVTKTTFYNHFESKDELILEVLRWHDRWWRDTFTEMLQRHGGDRPRDQLLALPDALHELFGGSDFNGCIFVNVSVEFPLPHDPAHEAAAEHKRSMQGVIRRLAGYAGADDPGKMADELSMVLEGAYVTQQVSHDAHTVEIARRLVELIVERHLGAS